MNSATSFPIPFSVPFFLSFFFIVQLYFICYRGRYCGYCNNLWPCCCIFTMPPLPLICRSGLYKRILAVFSHPLLVLPLLSFYPPPCDRIIAACNSHYPSYMGMDRCPLMNCSTLLIHICVRSCGQSFQFNVWTRRSGLFVLCLQMLSMAICPCSAYPRLV